MGFGFRGSGSRFRVSGFRFRDCSREGVGRIYGGFREGLNRTSEERPWAGGIHELLETGGGDSALSKSSIACWGLESFRVWDLVRVI